MNNKTNNRFYKLFLRFLKINNIYSEFTSSHIQFCADKGLKLMKLEDDNLKDTLEYYSQFYTFRDIFLNGIVISWGFNAQKWSNIDSEWVNLYNLNRIYGKYIKEYCRTK